MQISKQKGYYSKIEGGSEIQCKQQHAPWQKSSQGPQVVCRSFFSQSPWRKKIKAFNMSGFYFVGQA